MRWLHRLPHHRIEVVPDALQIHRIAELVSELGERPGGVVSPPVEPTVEEALYPPMERLYKAGDSEFSRTRIRNGPGNRSRAKCRVPTRVRALHQLLTSPDMATSLLPHPVEEAARPSRRRGPRLLIYL